MIFNPPFPVFKAGHSVSYSYTCDVCLSGLTGWISSWDSCLATVLCHGYQQSMGLVTFGNTVLHACVP